MRIEQENVTDKMDYLELIIESPTFPVQQIDEIDILIYQKVFLPAISKTKSELLKIKM